MAMTQGDMEAAIKAVRESADEAIAFMQKTHASDHRTPTHTRPNGAGAQPKSFYMKAGQVSERQGTKMVKAPWGDKAYPTAVTVTVAGNLPVDAKDEAAIARAALKSTEYMLIDDSDDIGGKFLMVTAIPSPYRGFTFTGVHALPQEVFMNVLVIRAAGQSKILSTYPADRGYVEGRPGPRYIVA